MQIILQRWFFVCESICEIKRSVDFFHRGNQHVFSQRNTIFTVGRKKRRVDFLSVENVLAPSEKCFVDLKRVVYGYSDWNWLSTKLRLCPEQIISKEEFAATHPVFTIHGRRTDSRGLGQLKKLAWSGRKENAFRSRGYWQEMVEMALLFIFELTHDTRLAETTKQNRNSYANGTRILAYCKSWK